MEGENFATLRSSLLVGKGIIHRRALNTWETQNTLNLIKLPGVEGDNCEESIGGLVRKYKEFIL